jgi:hypothetical protein
VGSGGRTPIVRVVRRIPGPATRRIIEGARVVISMSSDFWLGQKPVLGTSRRNKTTAAFPIHLGSASV